jgi:hypothetical protein
MSTDLTPIVHEFLNWARVACGGNGDAYLNGEVDRRGNWVADESIERDGWDDFDDICKRARKALRERRRK